MSYITTYLKKHFDPVNASIEDIDITDIAHALSLLCRANGHYKYFYSVAQHSLNCAAEAKACGYSKRVQLGCLLHDASEAYLSDVTRPMKAQLPKYLAVEEKLQNAIFDKWINPSLSEEETKLVFEIDDAVLYYEFINLMEEEISDHKPILKAELQFEFEDFAIVESEFISRFNTLLGIKEDRFVGVDWKSGKWLAVELHNRTALCREFAHISDLCQCYNEEEAVLIDIPIGLPETAEEATLRPDQAARDFLKNAHRKSSVFPVPFRQMVYADNQSQFWNFAKELGAKTTPQSYAIIKCIRQVDEFLTANPDWKNRLLESHPECAFQALNNGYGLEFSKHTEDGIKLRTQILAKYVDNINKLVDSVWGEAKEDILDALCLAVTAKVGYKPVPANPETDRKGLKMQILVADVI